MENRDSIDKIQRILGIYSKLQDGKVINKREEASIYGVNERSIQRDIDDIRNYLFNRNVDGIIDSRDIVYQRNNKGFIMTGSECSLMNNSEILATAKILMESRAFSKEELSVILNKLIQGCAPKEKKKLVSELIANENFHYVELGHGSYLQDKLWDLGQAIKEYEMLEITYFRQGETDPVTRRIQPLAIIFSEYYFYLHAYTTELNNKGEDVHLYDYPTIFRLDRIKSYIKLKKKFKVPYADRFQEGEFRKRIQFMYPGKLMKIELKYTGNSVEAILDRLPTAKIVRYDKNYPIIEAEVYGKGILMWLLSQGRMIEVLKPEYLREELKEILEDMIELYV